nr:MAG TPA: hypothetical protein [Caudoviricetes sp.]
MCSTNLANFAMGISGVWNHIYFPPPLTHALSIVPPPPLPAPPLRQAKVIVAPVERLSC